MKRREWLGAAGVTLLGGSAAATALGAGPLASNEPARPGYLGDGPVVYDRDQLQLQALQEPVRRGETIAFEVRHIGGAGTISLGCNNPWALQAYQDRQWQHATWTGRRYYQTCYTGLSPGETVTETVPLSRSGLAENPDISEVVVDLVPGVYRFVLIGSSPHLATNFRIIQAE